MSIVITHVTDGLFTITDTAGIPHYRYRCFNCPNLFASQGDLTAHTRAIHECRECHRVVGKLVPWNINRAGKKTGEILLCASCLLKHKRDAAAIKNGY